MIAGWVLRPLYFGSPGGGCRIASGVVRYSEVQMSLSAKAIEREIDAVRDAARSVNHPERIMDVTIRQGQDEDDDPIIWVLFDVGDRDRRDMAWVCDYTPFLNSVRRKLSPRCLKSASLSLRSLERKARRPSMSMSLPA